MKIFLYNRQITEEELKKAFSEMGPMETFELVMIDEEGNFHFEINAYGIHY